MTITELLVGDQINYDCSCCDKVVKSYAQYLYHNQCFLCQAVFCSDHHKTEGKTRRIVDQKYMKWICHECFYESDLNPNNEEWKDEDD